MIEFQCERCFETYRVDNAKAGERASCKVCGTEFTVPAAPPVPNNPAAVESTASSAADSEPPFGDMSAAPVSLNRDSALPGQTSISARGKRDAFRGRPFEPFDEEAQRKRSVFLLGVALVLGFLMPVCLSNPFGGGIKVDFTNIVQLTNTSDPLGIIFILYPLLAGIGLLLMGNVGTPIRGRIMVVLGIIPVVVGAIGIVNSGVMRQIPFVPTSAILVLLLSLLGVYGIYVGCRTRWYRPDLPAAYPISLTGGVAMLILLIAPFDGPPVVIAAFRALSINALTGLGVVISVLMLLAASLICLVNTSSRPPLTASNLSSLAFRLLLGSLVIGFAFSMVIQLFGGATVGMILMVITVSIKSMAWIGGILLLVPMGITDILIGTAEIDFNACMKCGYDLRASTNRVCSECGHPNPI